MYARYVDNPLLDFIGVPRFTAAVLKAKPIVADARIGAVGSFLISYFLCFAGAHTRNLLLSQPLAGITTATSSLPVAFAVWFFAYSSVGSYFFSLSIVRLILLSLASWSRVRGVVQAVSDAASVLTFERNVLGVLLVAFAQAIGMSLWSSFFKSLLTKDYYPSELHPFSANIIFSLLMAVSLTATHNTPNAPLVVAALSLLGVLLVTKDVISAALTSPKKPQPPKQQPQPQPQQPQPQKQQQQESSSEEATGQRKNKKNKNKNKQE